MTSSQLLPVVEDFVQLCTDGFLQGWHECNGGNLSYRLRPEEVEQLRKSLGKSATSSEWTPLGLKADNLAGQYLITTAAGCHFQNVAKHPLNTTGIVELNEQGDAYRIVWGFADGAAPTSELPSHILNHSVRTEVTGGKSRVIYHAHPKNTIALTALLPLDARIITRSLWKVMTECILVFPQGVGVLPWMMPGSIEIARASSKLFRIHDAVIWAHHGLFVAGDDFESAFGLMHSIEKAADIYLRARSANKGSDDFPNTISDDDLRAIADRFGLAVNEAFLDDNCLI